MGTKKIKISPRAREKYEHFLRLGKNELRPLPADRVPFDAHGISAEECFHQLESCGKYWYCREPEELERYMTGKEIHGMSVKAVAEDFVVSRIITSLEIRQNYPAWVVNEIFQQAKKTAFNKLGFVPTFVENSRDWSEMSQNEFSNKVKKIFA